MICPPAGVHECPLQADTASGSSVRHRVVSGTLIIYQGTARCKSGDQLALAQAQVDGRAIQRVQTGSLGGLEELLCLVGGQHRTLMLFNPNLDFLGRIAYQVAILDGMIQGNLEANWYEQLPT